MPNENWAPPGSRPLLSSVRAFAVENLPRWLLPARWAAVEIIPLNAHGKVAEDRLPPIPSQRPSLAVEFAAPIGGEEELVAGIWRDVLGLDAVGRHDPFFELGGSSLLMTEVASRLRAVLGRSIPLATFYGAPSVATFCSALARTSAGDRLEAGEVRRPPDGPDRGDPVAVVGMSCRFPGASTPEQFFSRLFEGEDLVTRLADQGEDAHGPGGPRHRFAGILEGVDLLDAEFFGITPAVARALDPQHRLFLECVTEALEDANVVTGEHDVSIGVFGGCGPSTYLINNLLGPHDTSEEAGRHNFTTSSSEVDLLLATDKDFLTNRASYALDLRGPSINVNGACATSLIALHLAVEALLAGKCDIAVAGGASVQVPQLVGYRYDQSLPLSPDGRTRVFDARSAGTVFGSGAGAVVLRRASDARRRRDDVYGMVLGTGACNDGAAKVGMSAPSVAGQAAAARSALRASGVDPASVGYIEAHGTGTRVGDPIEVAALSSAYGAAGAGEVRGIGSVKSNVGHLGWASGMAGLLKALMALHTGVVPPTLHHTEPNPDIDLSAAGLSVVTEPIGRQITPERNCIGVHAVGLGGSNAHAVLAQAPNRLLSPVIRRVGTSFL